MEESEVKYHMYGMQSKYNTLELPLHTVGGITQPNTMKPKTSLCGVSVVALIDSGVK